MSTIPLLYPGLAFEVATTEVESIFSIHVNGVPLGEFRLPLPHVGISTQSLRDELDSFAGEALSLARVEWSFIRELATGRAFVHHAHDVDIFYRFNGDYWTGVTSRREEWPDWSQVAARVSYDCPCANDDRREFLRTSIEKELGLINLL